jgi:hypothetical protein
MRMGTEATAVVRDAYRGRRVLVTGISWPRFCNASATAIMWSGEPVRPGNGNTVTSSRRTLAL